MGMCLSKKTVEEAVAVEQKIVQIVQSPATQNIVNDIKKLPLPILKK